MGTMIAYAAEVVGHMRTSVSAETCQAPEEWKSQLLAVSHPTR